uniref:DNA (cytosine-5-)-methyltransferase n=1 Tax=Macrostomum lignano TaxID=282301 RepID=A0A1I8IKC4_9PLAT
MAQPHSFSPSSSTYSSGSNRNSLSGLSSRPRLVSPDVTAIYEKVLDGSIALENVCLACGTVRVEQQLPLLMEHPVLRGSLCVDCLENYLTVCFSVGDDGWFMYCSVCGRPAGISQTEPHSLHHPPPPPELQRSAGCSQPLRVLSLFDGVASALLCLQSAGLSVEICFASEIDQDAIRVAACKPWQPVRQLGSVTELTEDRLRSLLPIDLLIGGSPCSKAWLRNPDCFFFSSFTEFSKLLRRIGSPSADERQRRPLFWLFENVASMRQEDKTRISRFLGREPIRLDAVIFSAQRRARLFWGNLPGMLRSSGVASTLAADVVHCARPAAAAGPEPREA